MNKKEELHAFYQSVRKRAPVDRRPFVHLQGPDAIWLSDQYLEANPRVAIIGQQVLYWYSYEGFLSQEVDKSIAVQRHSRAHYDQSVKGESPFWQFFHQVGNEAFSGEAKGWDRVLWTNLVKFVCDDCKPVLGRAIEVAAIPLQEDIMKEELRIAEPEICLFVTGPRYDRILERYFPGIRYVPLNETGMAARQFARLVHKDLPENSYRTYHPQYLRPADLWEPVFEFLRRELGWGK